MSVSHAMGDLEWLHSHALVTSPKFLVWFGCRIEYSLWFCPCPGLALYNSGFDLDSCNYRCFEDLWIFVKMLSFRSRSSSSCHLTFQQITWKRELEAATELE